LLLSQRLKQGRNLCVLELNDLLLTLLDKSTKDREQDVPGLEDAGHVRRRKAAILPGPTDEIKRLRTDNSTSPKTHSNAAIGVRRSFLTLRGSVDEAVFLAELQ